MRSCLPLNSLRSTKDLSEVKGTLVSHRDRISGRQMSLTRVEIKSGRTWQFFWRELLVNATAASSKEVSSRIKQTSYNQGHGMYMLGVLHSNQRRRELLSDQDFSWIEILIAWLRAKTSLSTSHLSPVSSQTRIMINSPGSDYSIQLVLEGISCRLYCLMIVTSPWKPETS